MRDFFRKWDIVFILIGLIIIAIIISILAMIFLPKEVRLCQQPNTDYIVVEYNPSCDCYQVVDVMGEMKGND